VKEGVEYEMPNFSWGWPEEEKKKVVAERRTDTALLKDIENVEELSCYSLLMDGEWNSGINNDELKRVLKSLSQDTRITFVDCHM
jgi:hypothetical protein